MTLTYFRIVRNSAVSEDDFKSARDLGKPRRDAQFARQWADGVSVLQRVWISFAS